MNFATAKLQEVTLFPRKECGVCGRSDSLTLGYGASSLVPLFKIQGIAVSVYVCPRCETAPKGKP